MSAGWDLAAQTEPGNQLAIPVLVLVLEVVKQLTALVDHPQETLPGVVIFLVLTEMIGQL